MVSESNRALSWNSMPMRLRISNSSCSRMRGEVLAEGEDLAGFRLDQAQRGLEQHGFAAARGAQDHARFAFARFERHVAQAPARRRRRR